MSPDQIHPDDAAEIAAALDKIAAEHGPPMIETAQEFALSLEREIHETYEGPESDGPHVVIVLENDGETDLAYRTTARSVSFSGDIYTALTSDETLAAIRSPKALGLAVVVYGKARNPDDDEVVDHVRVTLVTMADGIHAVMRRASAPEEANYQSPDETASAPPSKLTLALAAAYAYITLSRMNGDDE